MMYERAINVLKSLNFTIDSEAQIDELQRKQRGMGKKIAMRLKEILQTGALQQVANADERTRVVNLFASVWGAGPDTALKWFNAGLRTLEEVRSSPLSSTNQKMCIVHYDDLALKIPREEVSEHGERVRAQLKTIDPDLILEICGSYRRGKAICGDIDILITHPTFDRPLSLLPLLVQKLTATGFLFHHLTNPHAHDKYMGLCRLSPAHPVRHIDLKVYSISQWPYALLAFTGSAHFNRSMRAFAHTKGWSLTDFGIYPRSSEPSVRANVPSAFDCKSEQDVFRVLGLDYKPPPERSI
eukprot:GCRY01002656.1.p1 GENE.GCRY01002656.1~~GCRY01002656.1.p1  ORF type:complete len:298 (-),score=75.30 GCRY01002656.1:710-1603(-)